VFKNVFKYYTL
jgi:vacuolar protein sorting-associated protein 53